MTGSTIFDGTLHPLHLEDSMPLDRGRLDEQLRELGAGPDWWEQREFRDLPAILHEDENILALARGKVARVRWLRRSWLIVVTQQRLLCVRSGRSGWRQVEVAGHRIHRVTLRIGPLRGRLLVVAGSTRYRLLVRRASAYQLQSALISLVPQRQLAVSPYGPTRIVHRVMHHVMALPAVALGPDAAPTPELDPRVAERLDARIQALESEVDELRQQVEFLEQLLRERHSLPPSGGQATTG